jgi:hypothetical protein
MKEKEERRKERVPSACSFTDFIEEERKKKRTGERGMKEKEGRKERVPSACEVIPATFSATTKGGSSSFTDFTKCGTIEFLSARHESSADLKLLRENPLEIISPPSSSSSPSLLLWPPPPYVSSLSSLRRFEFTPGDSCRS